MKPLLLQMVGKVREELNVATEFRNAGGTYSTVTISKPCPMSQGKADIRGTILQVAKALLVIAEFIRLYVTAQIPVDKHGDAGSWLAPHPRSKGFPPSLRTDTRSPIWITDMP